MSQGKKEETPNSCPTWGLFPLLIIISRERFAKWPVWFPQENPSIGFHGKSVGNPDEFDGKKAQCLQLELFSCHTPDFFGQLLPVAQWYLKMGKCQGFSLDNPALLPPMTQGDQVSWELQLSFQALAEAHHLGMGWPGHPTRNGRREILLHVPILLCRHRRRRRRRRRRRHHHHHHHHHHEHNHHNIILTSSI